MVHNSIDGYCVWMKFDASKMEDQPLTSLTIQDELSVFYTFHEHNTLKNCQSQLQAPWISSSAQDPRIISSFAEDTINLQKRSISREDVLNGNIEVYVCLSSIRATPIFWFLQQQLLMKKIGPNRLRPPQYQSLQYHHCQLVQLHHWRMLPQQQYCWLLLGQSSADTLIFTYW